MTLLLSMVVFLSVILVICVNFAFGVPFKPCPVKDPSAYRNRKLYIYTFDSRKGVRSEKALEPWRRTGDILNKTRMSDNGSESIDGGVIVDMTSIGAGTVWNRLSRGGGFLNKVAHICV